MPETVPADIAAAIDAFDEAAQSHGWELDQGSYHGAEAAKNVHAARRAELSATIAKHLHAYADMKAQLDRIASGGA